MYFKNRSQLINFLRKKCPKGVLVANVPEYVTPQRGQTCKLYALSQAMSVYRKFIPDLPEARKGDQLALTRAKTKPPSLRNQIKTSNKSVVGEVYDPEILKDLAITNQMIETAIYEPLNSVDYIQQIERLIDANHTALVFYDISIHGKDKGYPIKRQGKFEHASCVVGYCEYNKELHFIICQWGKFYLHKAQDIADSALQIQQRKPETFYKLKPLPFLKAEWVEENAFREMLEKDWLLKHSVNEIMEDLHKPGKITRTANADLEDRILGTSIFDIYPDSNLMTKCLVDDFSAFLKEFTDYVELNKKSSKNYTALNELIEFLNKEKNNFNTRDKVNISILNCLDKIKKADNDGAFAHESRLAFRIMRKIVLALAILLSVGIAAYLKREYSYKTTGRYTLFADITKTKGKIDKLNKVLLEHTPLNFSLEGLGYSLND